MKEQNILPPSLRDTVDRDLIKYILPDFLRDVPLKI